MPHALHVPPYSNAAPSNDLCTGTPAPGEANNSMLLLNMITLIDQCFRLSWRLAVTSDEFYWPLGGVWSAPTTTSPIGSYFQDFPCIIGNPGKHWTMKSDSWVLGTSSSTVVGNYVSISNFNEPSLIIDLKFDWNSCQSVTLLSA